MASETNQDAPQSNGKATGGLKPTTATLLAEAIAAPGKHPHFIRGLALHFAETAIFLVAVIGAIALGLGITAYFGEHRYVLAYLVAYAGFRFSDLIVRDDAADSPPHEELSRRIVAQLPLLLTFAAAPFERTYVYGGAAPAFVRALGLLLELLGMWLALGARIQLGFFTAGRTARESGAGDARFLSLPAASDIRGHVPGDVRMDAHLRRAGHGDPDADHRRDFRAAADEIRRSGDACAIRRRIRRLHAYDGRGDSGYLVRSAAARLELAETSASRSLRSRGGSRTSRRIPRIRESIRRALAASTALFRPPMSRRCSTLRVFSLFRQRVPSATSLPFAPISASSSARLLIGSSPCPRTHSKRTRARLSFGVEQFPQVVILVALAMQRHRLDDVLAVAAQNDAGAELSRAQSFDRRHQFHAIVGG